MVDLVVKEADFEDNEELTFTNDVYNFTICANMTKCCTPVQLNISLKSCIIVFIIQMVTLYLFNAEFGTSNFVPVERGSTGIRIICTMLVHIKIYEEV